MDWPARSPDLNPIEHVWDALGRRIGARHPSPRTLVGLRTALLDKWGLLPLDLLQSLVNSMRARCETLIAVRETLVLLKLEFGNENVNKLTTFRWFSRYKNGMESVKDEKRVGRPILHRNPEKVRHISNLKVNPRLGLQDIEEETGIS
ncbi:hypothetical protein LAZ67_X002394 [Cordylochernes scorpioides]|uniref:Transposase n=1 Tax=Cordylochernes scorpioides TaxID=51811 RepID=A0ABY6LXK1_9ARAC|nr:hypothetical protein LAZ67_X002394 [Cordylochernes scorpioides]